MQPALSGAASSLGAAPAQLLPGMKDAAPARGSGMGPGCGAERPGARREHQLLAAGW